MIKKLLLAVALALPMSVMAQKFGFVDMQTVFMGMPETTTMQNELTELQKQYEEELGKLQEQVNKLYADFQAAQNDPAISQSIKDSRLQDAQNAMERADKFRNTAQQEMARANEAKMAPILQTINDAIKAVGIEGGYTMIFPQSQELLLYTGTDVTDLTKAVQAKVASISTPAK